MTDPTPMINGDELWTIERSNDPGIVDIYSSSTGGFEARDDDPGRFDYHPGGWDALAREIADAPVDQGEKQYTHSLGHVEGLGEDASIVLDDVVRGGGVNGSIQPEEGWFPG